MNDNPATTSSPSPLPTTTSTASHAVAAVSLKIPPFWPNDPAVWFAQVEAQFLTRQITAQNTKFAYVISSLSPEIAQEIRDLILSPPADCPYDTLKTELIRRTSASEQQRLQQLLISEELGDKKPSQFLRKLRQLLSDNPLEDGLLRHLFLQRLPTNVKLILASTPDTVSIDDLASLADKILDVAPPQHSLAAISTLPESSARKEIDDLRLHLNNLTTQLTNVVSHLQLSSRYRSRSRSRGRSPTRSGSRNFTSFSTSSGPFCWYHQQFGSAARKCNPPCSFKASASPHQSENFQARD